MFLKAKVSLPVKKDKKLYGETLKYVEIGTREYFKPWRILWIKDEDLIGDDGCIEFPLKGIKVLRVSLCNTHLVLTKGDMNLFYTIVDAPYRGKSLIDWRENSVGLYTACGEEDVHVFEEYKSEKGTLGISGGALFYVNGDRDKINVKWTREDKTGKRERGISVVNIDGDIIEEKIVKVIVPE